MTGDEDVGGLHVTVHEPGVVGVLQRVEDVVEHESDQRRGQAQSLDACPLQQRLEVPPLKELHRKPVQACLELDA